MTKNVIINACCKPKIFLSSYCGLKKITLISMLLQNIMVNIFYIFHVLKLRFYSGGVEAKDLIMVSKGSQSRLPSDEISPTLPPTQHNGI